MVVLNICIIRLPVERNVVIRKKLVVLSEDGPILEVDGQSKIEIIRGTRWEAVIAGNGIEVVGVLVERNGAVDWRWESIV